MKYSGRALQRCNSKYLRSCLWFIAAVGLAGGCGPATNIQVMQHHLQGAQRQLYLSSEQAYWAEGKTAGRVLAEFPLPGASTGRPAYLLYLRLPMATVSNGKDTDEVPACGFFIQTRGEDAGLTNVSSGTLRILQRNPNSCKIAINVVCEDGTQVEGEVVAMRNEPYINLFEKQDRPADVQNLVKHCATQTAPSG